MRGQDDAVVPITGKSFHDLTGIHCMQYLVALALMRNIAELNVSERSRISSWRMRSSVSSTLRSMPKAVARLVCTHELVTSFTNACEAKVPVVLQATLYPIETRKASRARA